MKRYLHLKERRGEFDYCGIHFVMKDDAISLSQPKAIAAMEELPVAKARRSDPQQPATAEELSAFRSVNGQ
eukprot:3471595-Lingulodinium_polyedra.AAC.1